MMSKLIFTPYGYPKQPDNYLAPTKFLDFEDPIVRSFTEKAIDGKKTDLEKAVALFYAVRDQIRYDAFRIKFQEKYFTASNVVRDGAAFCIPKAVLLAATARAVGIPSAIGLSDVVNHFTTPKLKSLMGDCDVFIHHGYATLWLEGKWVKAAPAFNSELCDRFGVSPTEFNGKSHALLQEYDSERNLRMEYLKDHGHWSDLPYERIHSDFAGYYPAHFIGETT